MKRWTYVFAALILSPAGWLGAAEPASTYLKVLPDDASARTALAGSPQIQIAQQQREQSEAMARLQADGPHEWIVSTKVQQRDQRVGNKYQEDEVSLSRTFRWLGKGGLDRSLGTSMSETAGFAYEDAWHEAGRSLLGQWFDWLRAASEARLLTEQLGLYESQLAATEKRVQAGDAPRIELQLAQAELVRARSVQMRAQQTADLLTLNLHSTFPQLTTEVPTALDAPVEPNQHDDYWIAQVVTNNHEIELAEGHATVSALAAQRAERDRIADPSIGVHYGRELDAQERIVGISFSIPLPSSARQNTYMAAQAEARRMQKQANQVRLMVERDARAAVLALRGNIKQWQLLASLAEQARTNAQTVAHAYTLGEYGLTETLAAQRQSLESALAAQSAQLDALQAQSRLWLDAHQLWALDHDHSHEKGYADSQPPSNDGEQDRASTMRN